MGFDERSDTTQHPANVVPLEMEEDDFDGFEDARSDPGDVGAAGGASAAGGSLAALEASADEFFESVQTGAAFAQGATVDSSAATPADPPSTASATDSAAAAGGASSATSASGPVVGGAGTADGGAAAGTATSSTDDAAPADGSPVAAGDGSASGGAADDASPPPAAAADDAGGLPDLIAPDGRVIRRRRRTITEADEVEDGKKSLEMATACKEEGNRHFGKGAYETAAACYTGAWRTTKRACGVRCAAARTSRVSSGSLSVAAMRRCFADDACRPCLPAVYPAAEALRNVPRGAEHDSQRAVYYCNRAACHMHAER